MENENCRMHGQVSRDSLYWMRRHLMEKHGPGGDWRGNKRPQDPTMCGQICGSICLMHRKANKSKSGPSRNQNTIMSEDYVVFSFLILMMRNSRISWRMLVESWKFRCQQQCLVKLHCAEESGKPAAPLEDTIILESSYVKATQIGNKWDCGKSSAQSERRDTCGAIAVGAGWWLVGGFQECYCYLRNIQDLLHDGKSPFVRRNVFWRTSDTVWSWLASNDTLGPDVLEILLSACILRQTALPVFVQKRTIGPNLNNFQQCWLASTDVRLVDFARKNGTNSRKSRRGSWWKSKTKSEVIAEAKNEGRKVHVASFSDLCHLKNSELEPQYQKYKGRVVLRGDIVKDDSGSYAVFTEQGSSASQMTGAKVMDILSRLSGCVGQAADAVSAPVKMEDAPSLFKISKVRMSRFLGTSTKSQVTKIMVQYGRSGRSSWAKSVRSSFSRTIMGKAIRESSSGKRMGQSSKLGELGMLIR